MNIKLHSYHILIIIKIISQEKPHREMHRAKYWEKTQSFHNLSEHSLLGFMEFYGGIMT